MQIEDAVIEALHTLPNKEKLKVLEFSKALSKAAKTASKRRRSIIGSLDHLNTQFTEEDMRAARREMWPNYDKDDE